MRSENECEQCSSTETIPHEDIDGYIMCTQCGRSTKIEIAEWECGNELRYATVQNNIDNGNGEVWAGVIEKVLQQKWHDQWFNSEWRDVPEVRV